MTDLMNTTRPRAGARPAKAPAADLAELALSRVATHRRRAGARLQQVPRNDPEAHRLRGRARVLAAIGQGAPKVLRIEITNAYCGSDYTAQLSIGSGGAAANVILDTGSSTVAVEPAAYSGAGDKDLKPSTLVQLVMYGTGGWAGPVVDTTLSLTAAGGRIALPNCPIALTSVQEKGNFQGVNGILGLAYNGLNNAYDFKAYLAREGKRSTYPWSFGKAWASFLRGFGRLIKTAGASEVFPTPYFDQLENAGVVANKFAFYTLRSFVSLRRGMTTQALLADPLNRGFFILGGGEEQTDLFTGAFVNVGVVHDLYYNTNLKAVRVGNGPAHAAAPLQQEYRQTAVSNSIVDSGTSDLSLAQDVYQAILQGLQQVDPAFVRTIQAAANNGVAASSLNLAQWPTIYFTLEGDNGQDVELACAPQTYWQTDFPAAGQAVFQISGPLGGGGPAPPNQSILGLPLLNNYYTVFDRTQDVNGIIRFAAIKPPPQ